MSPRAPTSALARLLVFAGLSACTDTAIPTDKEPAARDSAVSDTSEGLDVDVDHRLIPVCVNELMPKNKAAYTLDGETPDWVELHAPGSEDVPLDGWVATDTPDDPSAGAPLDGLVVPGGGFLVLALDDTDAPGHLPFQLSSDGDTFALFDPDLDGSVLTYGAIYDDFSLARATDCCTGDGCFTYDFRGTPGRSNTSDDPTPLPEITLETLMPAGSLWRYWDAATAPGDGWAAPGFDDAAWRVGAAPLGYGDDWIVTALDYGDDPAAKRPTAWLRTEVTVTDAAGLASLQVQLQADDGAAIYLNGAEALRFNLSDSAGPADYATRTVSDAEEVTPSSYTLDPALLVEGVNVIAVEVHQAAPDSSDLTLDLALIGGRWASP